MHRFSYLKDFLRLVYPHVCLACPNNLVHGEELICTHCIYDLPKTNFTFGEPNPIEQIFWGRTPIKAATALYWFEKGGTIQHVLHQLKYRQNKEAGYFLGKQLGRILSPYLSTSAIQVVCPVPLHPKKQKKRGYNQSEIIARGFSEITGIRLDILLQRTRYTETQTAKSKIDRWENVQHVFQLTKPSDVTNQHILLIDDVITTGATLEACAQCLLKQGAATVSIAALAYAVL